MSYYPSECLEAGKTSLPFTKEKRSTFHIHQEVLKSLGHLQRKYNQYALFDFILQIQIQLSSAFFLKKNWARENKHANYAVLN